MADVFYCGDFNKKLYLVPATKVVHLNILLCDALEGGFKDFAPP